MGYCVHYMYKMSGCVGNLNIQNYENSMGNYAQCMHVLSGFAEKLNIMNCIYLTENCVHYICA